MPHAVDSPTINASPAARDDLTRYLNAYWLRPENALWMTLRSRVLRGAGLDEPCVDVSCGDGIFLFLHGGGDFSTDFDVFTSVGGLERVQPEHADMFDHAADDYRPAITHRPPRRVASGCDLKPNLLKKAAALELYDELCLHDNNQPLPFENASFAGVYCNSAYWVRRIDTFLRELGRVTRDDGRVVLHVKLADMAAYTLEPFRAALGGRFLEIIGRGRQACWPTVATRAVWERRFRDARLEILAAEPFVTRTHAHLWDVGLRPLAPLLTRMVNGLNRAARAEIKSDWVALFEELLRPMCRADFELFASAGEPAEMQFVLRPRG